MLAMMPVIALPRIDRVIIAVLRNVNKSPLFTLKDRVSIIKKTVRGMPSVEVESFDGLLVDYIRRKKAHTMIRGLRVISDFEYEFQMAAMNRQLYPEVETVFLMASDRNQFISSRFVKEIAMLGGEVRHFVPAEIANILDEKFGKR